MKTKEGMISRLNFLLTPRYQCLFFYLLITILCPNYANGAASLCPTGWEINPNKTDCYIHIPTSHSWEDSYSLCSTLHNSYLPEPNLTSTDELLYLGHLCGPAQPSHNHSHACWLGNRFLNVPQLPTIHTYSDSCVLVTQNSTTTLSAKCNTSHEVICVLPIVSRCRRRHCHEEYFIILLSVSGLILGTTLAVVIWLLVFRRNKRRKRSRKTSNPSTSALVTPSWKVFTNEELRSITKNFSEGNRLIGDAKTGGTYSGLLPDGSRVAVKRLRRSSFQRKKEFYSAIGRVARLHHPNLVAIKGCRYDHGDRYIVYEFVANGPLDRWLHHIPRGGRSLDWSMRMTVATTLAQGIAFLHDKVKPHVVHQDIRASNVLLDEDFSAHLMGVGLSKFVPWEVMHERTVMAATYGYLAPEFVYRNELTTKSDVYSFGVLLLEIVSGRRPTQSVDSVGGWQTIFEWATPLVQSHCYLDLLDPLISDLPELGVVQKVVELVYSCTQHVPSVRPRMSHVVHQLQQLGLKSASEKARSGTSTGTCTSTATPIFTMEIEVNNV